MPKVEVSQKTKLHLHQWEFKGEMTTTGNKILYFQVCEKQLVVKNNFKCFSIWTLIYTKRILKLNLWKVLLFIISEFLISFSQFSFDLWEAILASDILLWKLTSPNLRNCIEKYKQCKVLDESIVRKNYMKQCYDLTIENIRDKIWDNFMGINWRNARLWGTVYCK
jgi:hypothetical protein